MEQCSLNYTFVKNAYANLAALLWFILSCITILGAIVLFLDDKDDFSGRFPMPVILSISNAPTLAYK